MPLRKKHVRRLVLVLVFVGVLGPLAGLAAYAVWLRGGGYGRALAAELESRLRCEAAVCGVRPTGPATAAADQVTLAWAAGTGRLTLDLKGVTAESNAYGWYVRAAQGAATLAGPDPAGTLAAINQRLVQRGGPGPLVSLVVDRLALRLNPPGRVLETEVRAVGLSRMDTLSISLHPMPHGRAPSRQAADESEAARPLAVLRLKAGSERGVFDGLHADARGLSLGPGRRGARQSPGAAGKPVRGSLDVASDWHWPQADARKTSLRVTWHDLDLAEWTGGMPGGPVAGKGEGSLAYVRPAGGPADLRVTLDCGRGSISADTLAWLAGLPAGLQAAGTRLSGRTDFDRLSLKYHAAGDRGEFEGAADSSDRIPLIVGRIGGEEIVILSASARAVDARDLWPPIEEALRRTAPPVVEKPAPPVPAE